MPGGREGEESAACGGGVAHVVEDEHAPVTGERGVERREGGKKYWMGN